MKKTILILFVFGNILVACYNKGEKITAKDAEKVEINKTKTTESYNIVKPESRIDWRASHLGGIQQRFGKIRLKSAEVLVNDNKITNASIVMNMTSFTVENFEDEESKNKLTKHLQSDDFFKIETYPTSIFELTNITETTGDYNSLVTGNLTILDTTKSITFKANITVSESNIIIKSEDFIVDRRDWGIVYHVEGTKGVPIEYIVSNDVGFTISVNFGK